MKHMGSADRVIRFLVAVGIAVLHLGGWTSGALTIILGILAITFMLTTLLGAGPGNLPGKISTRTPPAGQGC